MFLSDPLLLWPDAHGVDVVWFTTEAGARHVVELDDGRRIPATTTRLTRMDRAVHRHRARVGGLQAGGLGYRVISDGQASPRFTLRPAPGRGSGVRLLITSDHQAKPHTAANMELAAATVGPVDAVIMPGDLVNSPDRAADWFGPHPSAGDDAEIRQFLPIMQGRARSTAANGRAYRGAPLVQNVPLYPAIGNHEVSGELGPSSCSIDSYRQITGARPWYAVTIGNVRLITLFVARMWRGFDVNADPRARQRSRYQEASADVGDPQRHGRGCFIHESIAPGSPQWQWLVHELDSPQRRAARYTVVQMHEGPHGLGENLTPPFADPQRHDEYDDTGELIGIRYDYDQRDNPLLNHLCPLLEEAGVQLVASGHSHLWNRFCSGDTHYFEGSNTGNSYGAYTTAQQVWRHVPPEPWQIGNYSAADDPGGLTPQVPTVHPLHDAHGAPLPYVASDDHVVFQLLDTGTGVLTSWIADMTQEEPTPVVLDRFTLTSS